jgi:glycogen debranching enzyme
MGHALLTGIVDDDHVDAVVQRLASPELFTGWGVRTLGRSMGRYDPLSYHNGSVWPHDSALAAAGLARYGAVSEAHGVLDGLFDVAQHYDPHVPELFSGLARDDVAAPVDYPAASAPQAWAAASPVFALRTLLGLEPRVHRGVVHLTPALLPGMQRLAVRGLDLGGDTRVDIEIEDEDIEVSGLDPALQLVRERPS